MHLSRRDLAALLPALAAAQPQPLKTLPSKVYHSSKLPYDGDEKKKGRQFMDGVEHAGFHIEMHVPSSARAFKRMTRTSTCTMRP